MDGRCGRPYKAGDRWPPNLAYTCTLLSHGLSAGHYSVSLTAGVVVLAFDEVAAPEERKEREEAAGVTGACV